LSGRRADPARCILAWPGRFGHRERVSVKRGESFRSRFYRGYGFYVFYRFYGFYRFYRFSGSARSMQACLSLPSL
jgi:hypothetical protein